MLDYSQSYLFYASAHEWPAKSCGRFAILMADYNTLICKFPALWLAGHRCRCISSSTTHPKMTPSTTASTIALPRFVCPSHFRLLRCLPLVLSWLPGCEWCAKGLTALAAWVRMNLERFAFKLR